MKPFLRIRMELVSDDKVVTGIQTDVTVESVVRDWTFGSRLDEVLLAQSSKMWQKVVLMGFTETNG